MNARYCRIALVTTLMLLAGCLRAPKVDPPVPVDHSGQVTPPVATAPAAPAFAGFLRDLYRKQPFVSHPASGTDPGWLALPVSFEPVSRLRSGIESLSGVVLEHRGEAHITLITPPEAAAIREYDPGLTVDVLEAVARPWLDRAAWSTPGIGSLSQGDDETWFLVVESPDLRELRRDLAFVFQLPPAVFDPEAQDLHVTIGFRNGDIWPPAGSKTRTSLRPDLNWQAVLGL